MNRSFISKNHLSTILLLGLLLGGLIGGVEAQNRIVTRQEAGNVTERTRASDSEPGLSTSPRVQNSESRLNVWNAIVQTLVLAVIFYYTYQTRKMQMAMVRQIKLSVMPSFTLELVQLNVIDSTLEVNTYALQITNIGSGTALKIEIKPVLLPHLLKDRRKVGAPNLRFSGLGLLRRDDSRVVKHESFSGEQLVEEDYIVDFEDSLTTEAHSRTDLTITFQDIEGNNYRQKIHLTSTGCEPEAVVGQ